MSRYRSFASALQFRFVGEGEDRREECILPVRSGEVFELRVGNRSGSTAAMRLLVDGLNTVPEPDDIKGITTMVTGKRVNLNTARSRILDPHQPNVSRVEGVPTWAVRGFVTEVGPQGKIREFTVVEAEKSLAARQNFTDKLGIITAAFYSATGSTRGNLGIDAGKERTVKIRTGKIKIGDLLSVVHIRYVDANSL